jgi:Tfp pilus assembly protein PilN
VLDLIPEEFKSGQQRRWRLRLWLALTLLTVLIAAAWSGGRYLFYLREDATARDLAGQCENLKHQLDALAQEKDRLAEYQGRLALMDALRRYPDFDSIIEYLTQQTPDTVYLQKLEFVTAGPGSARTRPPVAPLPRVAEMFNIKPEARAGAGNAAVEAPTNPVRLLLRGYGVDHKAVAEYLDRLSQSGLFADVRFGHTRRQTLPNAEAVEFDCDCLLAPAPSPPGVDYAAVPKTQNL